MKSVTHLLSFSSAAAGPGGVWIYSSVYGYLQNLLASATGRGGSDADAMEAMRSLLFSTVGMSNKMYIASPPSLLQTPPFALTPLWKNFWATPRDGARLGLLFSRGGVWNGQQLVAAPLLSAAVSSSTPYNLAYGYLLWLNGKPSGQLPGGKTFSGSFLPSCPADAYAAVGANGQYAHVQASSFDANM